jgi:hypothetical protein
MTGSHINNFPSLVCGESCTNLLYSVFPIRQRFAISTFPSIQAKSFSHSCTGKIDCATYATAAALVLRLDQRSQFATTIRRYRPIPSYSGQPKLKSIELFLAWRCAALKRNCFVLYEKNTYPGCGWWTLMCNNALFHFLR